MKRVEPGYRLRVFPLDAGTEGVEWMAEVPDLPGCAGAGMTPGEAATRAMEAIRAWMEAASDDGRTIPESRELFTAEYEGKVNLNLPRTLHRDLSLLAEEEEVSLEQYLLYLIMKGLNREMGEEQKSEPEEFFESMGGRVVSGVDFGRVERFRPGIPAGKVQEK